jgi:Common central domain of tyrosinase
MIGKLLGFVIVVLGALSAQAQAQVRIREDIDTISHEPTKLSALKLAFQTLRDSTDTTSNLRHWANIHGAVPPDVSTGPCTHKEEGIWAWHRAYLWEFEDALRASHPPETSQVTLPYWNWTAPPSGQRYPSAYEDTSSPLFWSNRISSPHSLPPVPSDSESNLLSIPDWRTFGGWTHAEAPHKSQMEVTVHDTVHSFVGVDMSSTQTSARDPIFWAHHANLDRIWLTWQAEWHQDPAEPTLPMHGLHGTQGDWVDVSDKYTYGPPATGSPFVFEPTRLVAIDTLESTHELTDALTLPASTERVHLVIKNIKYPEKLAPFVGARIYLIPPDNDASVSNQRNLQAHFLAYFTDWLATEHDHHDGDAAHNEPSIIIDVTDRISAIRAATANKKLKLVFELSTQDANGNTHPLAFGGPDGITFDTALEVVRIKDGKQESKEAVKMKSLK